MVAGCQNTVADDGDAFIHAVEVIEESIRFLSFNTLTEPEKSMHVWP